MNLRQLLLSLQLQTLSTIQMIRTIRIIIKTNNMDNTGNMGSTDKVTITVGIQRQAVIKRGRTTTEAPQSPWAAVQQEFIMRLIIFITAAQTAFTWLIPTGT